MNSVKWKNPSLKYQRFTPSGGKNIGIGKSEFVTKTQFLNTRKDIFLIIMKQKGLTGSAVNRFKIDLAFFKPSHWIFVFLMF